LLRFRFNGPIVFFNAPYFKQQALAAAAAVGPELKWFVVDMIPITMIDVTGPHAARDVIDTLRARGVVFATAGRQTERAQWAARGTSNDLWIRGASPPCAPPSRPIARRPGRAPAMTSPSTRDQLHDLGAWRLQACCREHPVFAGSIGVCSSGLTS